jgi:Arc/MetJ-type ribon-helix-helix transcriptional regulator
MTDKSETISFRVTPEMRTAVNEFAKEQGYGSEADAMRGLIRRNLLFEETLGEAFDEEAKEEILAKLDEIQEEMEKDSGPFWKRLF